MTYTEPSGLRGNMNLSKRTQLISAASAVVLFSLIVIALIAVNSDEPKQMKKTAETKTESVVSTSTTSTTSATTSTVAPLSSVTVATTTAKKANVTTTKPVKNSNENFTPPKPNITGEISRVGEPGEYDSEVTVQLKMNVSGVEGTLPLTVVFNGHDNVYGGSINRSVSTNISNGENVVATTFQKPTKCGALFLSVSTAPYSSLAIRPSVINWSGTPPC